ncbi:alpha/beta hydrolase [Achromobacter deleyi]|uniref:alpha/beta hydrolase n=1 Tax=Achromobacter deleyi TaxID=1353891 RepID=UPI0014928C92|nr:alpha/beta hydrolase [Achromobacter deleyi]QVQ27993.1 alpha/beta hydrolase [Achromobacter deleyi]UIP23606.1 alpha/beta hydrolase [Achromobacter deleyi]
MSISNACAPAWSLCMIRAARTAVLSAGLALLAACSSPVQLMPTPVKFTTGQIDPFEHKEAKGAGTAIPLLYATNRAVFLESRQPFYSIFPSDTLRLGVAQVQIGDGTLDWEQLRRLSTSASERGRPVLSLERMEELVALTPQSDVESSPEAQAYFALINQALEVSQHRDLIIYVHGFNNAVWRGTAQAAQFHHFTGRQAVVLAFLWPSAGSLLAYATDVRSARASVPAFARLIELLSKNTNAEHINVLAFSAGARIASEGLASLAQPKEGETREELRARLRLGQIYFAAPDEDTYRFVTDLRQYIDLTQRVSLGANLGDRALRFAARHQRASRAGRPSADDLTEEQVEFVNAASQRLNFDMIRVDPRNIPGLGARAHSFWFSNAWVSSDVLMQFLWHKSPAERGLQESFTPEGMRFWTFPVDYDQRVEALMRAR